MNVQNTVGVIATIVVRKVPKQMSESANELQIYNYNHNQRTLMHRTDYQILFNITFI